MERLLLLDPRANFLESGTDEQHTFEGPLAQSLDSNCTTSRRRPTTT